LLLNFKVLLGLVRLLLFSAADSPAVNRGKVLHIQHLPAV
jgi:hypothetical protein